jgi:signal transduction histidine kinase/ActR/RegA family two-component response regulator
MKVSPVFRPAAVVIFFPLVLALLSGCGNRARLSGNMPTADYVNYRDVPEITEEEIRAIETLARSTPFFTYGMTQSTECFRNENNITKGFSALVCEWLSGFFGIKFRPVIYNWDALQKGIENYSISFSGEIASSLEDSGYYMTNSIAERKIQFVSMEGSNRLAITSQSRDLLYGFLEGTVTEDLVSPYIRQNFKAVPVANYTDAYQKLILKEIDALFMDDTVEGIFSLYGNLIIEDFQPLTYNRVSLATKDPALAPIVSVVEKYLHSAGSYKFVQMYDTGLESYKKYNLYSRLNFNERHYVMDHLELPIPVVMENDNYPVSFYNFREDQWQGIAVDILKSIERLSGLQFECINDPGDTLETVIRRFSTGEAAMTMEMIQSAEQRKQDYLLSESPYQTDYYAFISAADKADVTLSDIPYKRVGLIKNTAYENIFRELFPNHRYSVEYQDRLEAISALEKGEVDLLMGTRNLLLSITNYMEKTGYKASLVLLRPYESNFGFKADEALLASIVSKAQSLIDTNRIVDSWTRRVFDYSGALARAQKPFLLGASALMGAALVLVIILLLRNRQMALNLEKTVEQRTHELKERGEELEVQTLAARVASRAKGEFLARMSHEIRTPLNAVIGMTEIARRAETIQKKDSSLEEIASASNHLLGILNDVLDMSKIESGKFSVAHEPFGLNAAMGEVAQIIRLRCEEKHIVFTADFTWPGDPWVMGDKLRLKQVLINLLGNAVKFTPEGGNIGFTVHGAAASPDGDPAGPGRITLHFKIRDSGIGIKEEQLKNLFNAFEQADNTIAVRFGGTGLGLAISQNLVKLMGGLITVSSEYGRGSNFEFTLDAETAKIQAPAASFEGKIPDLTGKRMLLAEDIEINRIILKELLSETHLEIEEASDGKKALSKFSASPESFYDLIFMDVQMPNMDGHEATRAIRSLKRKDASAVPIIAMTANAYKEDIDKALDAGMNGHLAKPIVMNEVLASLDKWLG